MKHAKLPWAARPPSWPELFVIALAWLLTGCAGAILVVAGASATAGFTAAAHMPDSIEQPTKGRP